MCPECAEEWMRWLDYRPPPPIRILQNGKPEATVHWWTRTKEVIRTQQALIKKQCKEQHGKR